MVTRALFRPGPWPSGRLLAIGWVALRGSQVTIVLILVAWRRAVMGVQVVVVVMVGVWVVMVVVVAVVMMVVVVCVVVVAGQTVSPATLASHWRAATVANRRVASLWHVMGVWSTTGRELPGANGRGRGRRRGGV